MVAVDLCIYDELVGWVGRDSKHSPMRNCFWRWRLEGWFTLIKLWNVFILYY